MNPEYLKKSLKSQGLSPNFTYGQNFLMDEVVLEDMVGIAGVTKDDAVLEIGPGIGNLTERLAGRSKFLLSIEKDPKFLPILKKLKKEHKNFQYEIADALSFNFGEVFKQEGFDFFKVVANIPYYITGKILQMLLTGKFKPKSITILMQKEVAQNVVAKRGELSILALSVQLYGVPKIVQVVPAQSFFPAPKVDSAVLHVDVYEKPKYTLENEKRFFKIVKACFSGKRKQLHNTLVNNLHVPKQEVEKILTELNISPTVRPQELSLEQWIELSKKIE